MEVRRQEGETAKKWAEKLVIKGGTVIEGGLGRRCSGLKQAH